jgi:hypothetical protein
MKQIYPLAILLLALTTLTGTITAQSYSGGSYTAVRNGKWHTPSGPNVWDPNGEPPATCNSCLITINSGLTVTMNADVTLSGNSLMVIQNDPANATKLVIPFSSAVSPATPFPIPSSYNRISLVYGDHVSIDLAGSNATLDASTSGTYDGVFLAVLTPQSPNTYFYIPRVGTSAIYTPATAVSGPSTLSSNGTLPIILSAFDAILDNAAVELTWTTGMELNAAHFSIERSTNAGASWTSLGTVKATGFSSLPVNYQFTDGSPVSGTDQYRLQSVDMDGKFTYSDVKVVRVGVISKVRVFPNPARDNVNITLGEGNTSFSGSVRILSLSGQVIAEKVFSNTAGGTTISMSVGGYAPGNYLVLVSSSDGTQQVTKLAVTR